jgi:hypothetical protein
MGFNVKTPPRPTPKVRKEYPNCQYFLERNNQSVLCRGLGCVKECYIMSHTVVDDILDNIAFDLMTIKVDTSLLDDLHTRDTIPYMERMTPASLNVLKEYNDD